MKKPVCIIFGLMALLIGLSTAVSARVQASPQSGDRPGVPKRFAENETIPEDIRTETFKIVWETVRDKYYDPAFGGKDWEKIGAEYRPLAAATVKSGEFHAVLGRMLAELGRSHLAVNPPHLVANASGLPDAPRFLPAGAAFCAAEGYIAVSSVAPDSAAWAAGLRPGNIIVKAGEAAFPSSDDVRKQSMRALAAAKRALSGPEGSLVEMTVRAMDGLEKTLSILRAVPFKERANLGKSIFEYRRVHPRVGYIRSDGWAFDLPPKLEAALKELWDSDGLIIDCRQNRGGVNPGVDYLAKRLCAEPGLLGVETTRSGERREWKHEGSGEAAYRGVVAILIDDGSGSASEVFSSAMQEKGRAVIFGRMSYGGVLNSTQAPLPTGGVLQYPHADMRTPKGRSIEGLGVTPDIPTDLTLADLAAGKDTVIERAVAEILGRREARRPE